MHLHRNITYESRDSSACNSDFTNFLKLRNIQKRTSDDNYPGIAGSSRMPVLNLLCRIFLAFAFIFVLGDANNQQLPSPPPGKSNYHATNYLDVNKNVAQHTGCTLHQFQTQLREVSYLRWASFRVSVSVSVSDPFVYFYIACESSGITCAKR